MSKTKLMGIFGLIASIGAIGVDILDGGGFNFRAHLTELLGVFGSLGLIFLRGAVQKVLDEGGSPK